MPNEYYISRDQDGKATLKHFKYVKRERKGDGWKYYYSWDEVKNAGKKAANNVKNTVGFGLKKDLKTAQKEY